MNMMIKRLIMRPIFANPVLRCLFGALLAFCGITGMALPAAAADANLLKAMEEEIASLMEKNRLCVVSIQAITQRRIEVSPDEPGAVLAVRRTVGSGIIFDDKGHVLTTGVVIGDADDIQVSLASGQTMDADLVAVDEDSKVAVLQLHGKAAWCPRFGDSDRVRMGHYAFIIGNAYGTMAPSVGNIVDVHGDDSLIQISGSAWPGNSGAPVFNSDGQVIGIVRGILAPSAQETLSDGRPEEPGWNTVPATLLAIPINRARQIAQELMSRGWLGIEVVYEVKGGRRRATNLSKEDADGTAPSGNRSEGDPVVTKVSKVVAGGPASEAGLQAGDVIVSYNGETVLDGEYLGRLVAATSPGKIAQVALQRDGQRMAVQVRVGQRGALASRKAQKAPAVAYEATRGPETPEMLLQRLRALEQQMQMLIQQQQGRKEK